METVEVSIRDRPRPVLRAIRYIAAKIGVPRRCSRTIANLYNLGPLLRGSIKPDLVVSSGGDCLLANIAMRNLFGVPNIVSGSIARFSPTCFSIIIHPDRRFRDLPNAIIATTPSPISFRRRDADLALGNAEVVLLIGGPIRELPQHLWDFTSLLNGVTSFPARVNILTSRRTPNAWAKQIEELAATNPQVYFQDYRLSGPGGVQEALSSADIALVTGDSTTMVSDATSAGLPTIVLLPDHVARSDPAFLDRALLAKARVQKLAVGGTSWPSVLAAAEACSPYSKDPAQQLGEIIWRRISDIGARQVDT